MGQDENGTQLFLLSTIEHEAGIKARGLFQMRKRLKARGIDIGRYIELQVYVTQTEASYLLHRRGQVGRPRGGKW